jgi:tetratricopeptide (TPR) repeat protein
VDSLRRKPLVGGAAVKRKLLVVAAFAALLAVAVYLPSCRNDFVNWDDSTYVTKNPYLRVPDAGFVRWALGSFHAGNWHPLTWLSLGIDYALWGLNPAGYHLTSIVLHGLNTFLVVALVGRLFGAALKEAGGRAVVAAALAGVVFGLHPIHVESVAWVSERKDVLYSFFWLLSLHAYITYAGGPKRKALFYRLCLVFFILSLMSKPMAVTLPLVLLILDFYPLGRFSGGSSVLKVALYEKLPFYVLSLAASVVTVIAQTEAIMSLEVLLPWERLLIAVRAVGFYLLKTAFPRDLVPFYPLQAEIVVTSLEYLGALCLFVVITTGCFLAGRRTPLFAAAWAYYVVTLLPTLGIVQVGSQMAADRYMYLPVLGPLTVAGACAAWAWERWRNSRTPLLVLMVFLAGVLSYMTLNQTRVWNDSFSLWSYVTKKNPEDPFSRVFSGRTYFHAEDYGRAIKYFDEAIALDSTKAYFYSDRGHAYLKLEQYDTAIKDFGAAISLEPEDGDHYMNRGNAYYALGRYDMALKDYDMTLRLDPGDYETYFNRAFIFSETGRVEDSIEDYLKAVSLKPDLVGAYNNLGINYLRVGEYGKAVESLDKAILLDVGYGNAYFNRGRAHEMLGDLKRAASDYQKAYGLGYEQAGDYLRKIK